MDRKYQYASMREYTEIGQLQHQNHQLNDNNRDASDSDVDIIDYNMDIGRGRKTANDCKQWIFVVKRTNSSQNLNKYFNSQHNLNINDTNETQPLLNDQYSNMQSATDALNSLHHAQTRSTLEMDIRRTDLHISPAKLPDSVPSPVPNVDFLYVGISEKRMRYWCDKLEYQLNLDPSLIVEWLLLIDNQLAHATNNDAIENRQFNLQCWRDLYVRYYSNHVNEEIYKFYRKYGYGYDESYAKDQFHIATDDNLYSRDISQGSIFREVDRIRLTKFSFQSNLSSTLLHGYMSTFPIDQIDKRIKDKNNVLIDAFPCHEYDVLADVYSQIWSTIKCTAISSLFQIPLAGIRDYYGEKWAYYFLFLVSYTQYMIPLASVGFFFQIYQYTNGNVEVELIGFFSILVLIWGAIIPLLWKQQESRYACRWGQYSNETTDPEHLERIQNTDELSKNRKIHYLFEPEMERVEFKGKPRRSTIDGAIIKTDDELQKIKNYCASYGLLLVVIVAVTGLSVTIVVFEFFIQYYISDTIFVYGTYGFGILNAICMLIMEYVSLWFIPMINNFENHRTNITYKKSFISKKITFDFINYYISLLFIIFVIPLTNLNLLFLQCKKDNCLVEMQTHFGSVFVTLIVIRLFVYLYNFTCGKYSYRVMKRVPSTAYFKPFYDIHSNPQFQQSVSRLQIPPSRKPELTANEYLLYEYQTICKPLNEFLIQFGYLITFGLFFPWAAPISLFYNLLVIRLELHTLVVYSRRPFPEGASGIGFYTSAMKFMTMSSILVGFYVFTVDSYELRIVRADTRMFPKLLDWVALVVIFLLFYAILLWLFPSVPTMAKDHIKRQMFIDQSIATNHKNMKSFQESITISSLLRLRKWNINEVYNYFNEYGHPRFHKFAKILKMKKINGEKLLFITKRDLQLFGIENQFHRMWIEQEIESLKLLHHHISNMINSQTQITDNIDTIHMDTLKAFMNKKHEHETHQIEIEEEIEIQIQQEEEKKDDDNPPGILKVTTINEEIWESHSNENNINKSPQTDSAEINFNDFQFDENNNKNSQNVSDAETYDSNNSNNNSGGEIIKSDAYKSLSTIGKKGFDITVNDVVKNENVLDIISISSQTNQNENELKDDEKKIEQVNVAITIDNKFIKFGNIEIGKLTKSIGGKSLDDYITLKDIIKQFQCVIKQQARVKLIKSFAAKKIKVNEFKLESEIYGLLELIILLVIKLKYKDNVTFNKQQIKKNLNQFVQWIVNDKDCMNGEIWNVNKFAQVFDQWIAKIIFE